MKNYFAHLKKIHAGRSPIRLIVYFFVLLPAILISILSILIEAMFIALEALDEWHTDLVDSVRDWALERKNEL